MLRMAGPLEQSFNSSFSLHETSHYSFGRELPSGRHPLDDLRQNMLIVAREVDEGKEGKAIVAQDSAQDELCMMSVRGVRLLLPGGELKPGLKVVLLSPFPTPALQDGVRVKGICLACHVRPGVVLPVFILPGSVGTVVVNPVDRKILVSFQGVGTCNVEPQQIVLLKDQKELVGIDQQGEETREPLPKDLIARPPHIGSTVVLHGLVSKPELNGRMGIIEPANNFNSGGEDSDGSSDGNQGNTR